MLRKLPSQVAAYLSTNQPILWAARIDVAIALAIGLWTLYLILSWIIGRVLADHRDALTQNMRTGPVILLLVLGVSAVLFWFSGVQRAAYREVAPSRRRHPSVVEL